MLNKQYIKAAIDIRNEFLKTSQLLETYEKDLKEINSKIEKTINNLIDIKKGLNPTQNQNEVQASIIKEMELVEVEGAKYSKLIKPLSDKMEDLQKRETALYTSIKSKYPKITDDEIINELKKWIKK